MKKFIYSFTFLAILSCKEQGNEMNRAMQDQLANFEAMVTEEKNTRDFIEAYVNAMNSDSWSTEMLPFLRTGEATDNFLKEHKQFRRAFSNLNATIKHMVVDGNEAIVWLEETATFVEPYAYEGSDYGDGVLNGIKANNQSLKWTEVWYFDVVNGKFGDKFDFLKDNYSVLKGLGELGK